MRIQCRRELDTGEEGPLNPARVLGAVGVAALILGGAAPSQASMTLAWSGRYNLSGTGVNAIIALAPDTSGATTPPAVYALGSAQDSNGHLRFLTIKYSASGTRLWTRTQAAPATGDARPVALAVDPSGDVVVTGSAEGLDGHTHYLTVKYDGAAGSADWTRLYSGPAVGDSVPAGIAIDDAGDVFVTGSTTFSRFVSGNVTYYSAFATIKYDSSGTAIWHAYHMDADGGSVAAAGITIGNAGERVCVAGTDMTASGHRQIVTACYDANGIELWANTFRISTSEDDACIGLSRDSEGNVIAVGNHFGGAWPLESDIIKYNGAGGFAWSHHTHANLNAFTVDAVGDVIVAGFAQGASGHAYDVSLFDPSGNNPWHAIVGNTSGLDNEATGVAVDATGNVYVTGKSGVNVTNSVQNFQALTVELGPSGQRQSSQAYFAGVTSIANAVAVAPGAAGVNIFVGGSLNVGSTVDSLTLAYTGP